MKGLLKSEHNPYKFRRAAKDIIEYEGMQGIIHGKYCSGKSLAVTTKGHLMCMECPRINIAVCTQYPRQLDTHAKPLYDKVLRDSGVEVQKHHSMWEYPNGSRVIFAPIGHGDYNRLLATELVLAVVLNVDNFGSGVAWTEILVRTIRAKNYGGPYGQIIGCYTEAPTQSKFPNWIRRRKRETDLETFRSLQIDNPMLYNTRTETFTEEGEQMHNYVYVQHNWRINRRRTYPDMPSHKAKATAETGIDVDEMKPLPRDEEGNIVVGPFMAKYLA